MAAEISGAEDARSVPGIAAVGIAATLADGDGRPPAMLLAALEVAHRQELAKMRMALLRYRALLAANGIEPPDSEGEDLLAMWRDCQQIILAANDFVARLGSAKELLEEDWR